MKTRPSRAKQRRGLALLVVVLTVAVAAFFFTSYLVLTEHEYNMASRSQEWNNSLTVAEAGVEEGLALVNKYAYLSVSLTNWSATASADGWANLSSIVAGSNTYSVYFKRVSLPNSSGSYSVYVTNVAYSGSFGAPVILSIGTVTNGYGVSASRTVLVQTKAIALAGQGGVIAWDGITESGGTIMDGWDSSTSLHSVWQSNYLYRANFFSHGTSYGVWATNLSFVSNTYPSRLADVYVFTDTNVLNMSGAATIAGYIQTGPGGTISLSGGSVGDLPWCFGASGTGPGTSGVEPGHSLATGNMNFHSYALPVPTDAANHWMNWSNIPAPGSGSVIKIGGIWEDIAGVWTNVGGTYYTNKSGNGFTIGGVTYPLVITNRLQNTNPVYYAANQINGQNLFVDAQYVVLYLTNGLTVGGGDYLTINTNADLQLWSTGTVTGSGSGVINNIGNYTHAFSLYDVAGYPITVTLSGAAAATGYYYLPSSNLTISGGGGGSSDFAGAIVCYNLTLTGGQRVHFDQSLGASLPPDQFVPASWNEVAPSQ